MVYLVKIMVMVMVVAVAAPELSIQHLQTLPTIHSWPEVVGQTTIPESFLSG